MGAHTNHIGAVIVADMQDLMRLGRQLAQHLAVHAQRLGLAIGAGDEDAVDQRGDLGPAPRSISVRNWAASR
jgi:hypothetical protein